MFWGYCTKAPSIIFLSNASLRFYTLQPKGINKLFNKYPAIRCILS